MDVYQMTIKSEGMMIPGKLKWYAILALALWLAFSGVAAGEQLYVNESGWWRDGGAFNASGAPIQAAVGAAGEGDAIFVWNGSYNENVDVDKPRLTLEGEGADVVTVTAADPGDHVFEVADVNYVNISGFAVRGATNYEMAGIRLTNADYCDISGNNAYGNTHGIDLDNADDNMLTSNTASNNDYGIFLWQSGNNTLANNAVNSNNYGINLDNAYDNMLTNNAASNSGYGITLWQSGNNTLANNAANSNDWVGISLEYSSNNMLTSNTASNNNYGISPFNADDNTLTNNAPSNNDYGIALFNADDNDIVCNWVQDNTERGFYLTRGSTGNNISYNNIIENGNYNATSGGWEWQFYIDQYNPVEAKHNYWGAGINNITIDASIYDDDEGNWGEVVFYPFETEPVPCAPGPKRPAFTTTDAVIALEIAVGSRPPDLRWDVSGDGSVTSLDALMILQAADGGIEIG
jgi:parallel beta-helix repeat protein